MTVHRLHIPGLPECWASRLAAATNEHDVVVAARDFLSEFTFEEVKRLPEICRPFRIVDGQDITWYAMTLLRHKFDPANREHGLETRLTTFFSEASVRLAQVALPSEDRESA